MLFLIHNLSMAMQMINVRAKTKAQVSLVPKSHLFHCSSLLTLFHPTPQGKIL